MAFTSFYKQTLANMRKGKGGLKGQEEGRRQTGEKREKKIQMRAGQDPGRKVRKAEKKATQ